MIVPTLRVGMQPGTLRVPRADAERPVRHSHTRAWERSSRGGAVFLEPVCPGHDQATRFTRLNLRCTGGRRVIGLVADVVQRRA